MLLKAIIFDWAGTAVDFGSLCPVRAFQSAFSNWGVSVEAHEVHRYMGMRKREHIETLLGLPDIAARWQEANGRKPSASDIDKVYKKAEELLIETAPKFAIPTPHLVQTFTLLRSRGLKLGSTTGYTTAMVERMAQTARREGFAPDTWVASDMVPQGRPWPWMIYKNMERLQVCPPATVVKVGDTMADIAEAINAGVWCVGVVESSSMVGMSEAELNEMPAKHRKLLLRKIRRQMADGGAHFVINNFSEFEETLERIEDRLDRHGPPPRLERRRTAVTT